MKTIVGRGDALAQLDNCLGKALKGQRQLVFITGEAGIGKTTLADLFHQRAAFRPNLRVARGQCVEGFGGKEAYYPMLEAIGQLLREADGSPVVQSLVKRAPTWLIQFPSLVKAEQREALQKEILGATRERMMREICEALEGMTTEHPLVLIFEDLHWVDPSTLDLISALARRRGPAKLVLLGTYRPADVIISQSPLKALKQDLLIHDLCHEIALERLEESDVAEYLSTQFPESQFPEGLAKLVYRHSGGNALFMVGIVQDMVKKGLIAHTHARWTLTTPLDEVDTGAPETLQQMIQVQFEQLSESEQSVLKSACVAGESFSVWAVTTTLEMQASRIEDVCEGLAERQQFIKAAGIHELANGEFSAYYEFRHSLYREILYRRLSDVSRSKLHRLLGERLKALCTPEKQEISAELALHFEESHEYEQAIQYLLFTAENAAKRFALRGSVEVLQHALELVPRIPPGVRVELELRILGRIGDVHYALGNMPAAAEVYKREAIGAASAGLPEVEVNALSGLARAAAFSDGDRGMAACEQAVEVSMRHNDPLLLARAQMLAASFRLLYDGWRREDAELCASADRTLRLHSEAALPAYYWMMYSHIQSLQGDYQGALESDEVGTSKTVETASLMVYLAALSGKVFALVHLGRFGDVLRIVQSGEEMSKKNGNDPWLSIFRSLEVWLRTLAFDFEGALRVSRMVLDKDTGQVAPRLKVLLHTGFAQLELANYDEALQCFQKLLSQEIAPKDFLHWYWRMSAQLGLSNVWLASGITAKAHHEADIFLASALATADPNMQALAWEMKARVAIAEKDFVSAQECVGKAETILEKFEIPCSAWRVHATAYHLFTSTRNDREAERHRSRAEACVLALANSFSQDEPLRATFLAAEPVRRILNKTVNDRVRERRSSSAPR